MQFVRHLSVAISGFALLVAAATLTTPARAQTQALDFTGGSLSTAGTNDTLGWSFSLSAPVTVTQLGFFDAGNNGLTNSHQIGLWTNSGTLLTSVTISSGLSGTAIVSNSGLGAFRYVNVASVLLAPGTYVLGASYAPGDADGEIGNASSANMTAGFAFGQLRYKNNGGFTFPSSFFNAKGVFGPNLRVGTAGSAAPEPGSFALALMGVIGGIAARRRRK